MLCDAKRRGGRTCNTPVICGFMHCARHLTRQELCEMNTPDNSMDDQPARKNPVWSTLEVAKLLVPLAVVTIASFVAKDYFDGIEKDRSDLTHVRVISENIYAWIATARQFDASLDDYFSMALQPSIEKEDTRFLRAEVEDWRTKHRERVALWVTNLQGNRFRIRRILSDSGMQTEYEKLLHTHLNSHIRTADQCLRERFKTVITAHDPPACSNKIDKARDCGEYLTNALAQLITKPEWVVPAIDNVTKECK